MNELASQSARRLRAAQKRLGEAMRPRPVQRADGLPAYASLPSRMLAVVLDMMLVTLVLAPLSMLLSWLMETFYADLRMTSYHARYLCGLTTALLWVAVAWLYEARMIASPRQATYGKQLLGLRVTSVDGEGLDFARASARHYGKYLAIFPLGAGVLAAIFTARRQGLHDAMSGAVVIRRR